MHKIIVINGSGGVGKDTFIDYCFDYLYTSENINCPYHQLAKKKTELKEKCNIDTVKLCKEIAYMCGWAGTKDEKNRKFLSDLKDLLTEWRDIPFLETTFAIDECLEYLEEEEIENGIVFVHTREPKDIQRYVDKYESQCITMLIRNPHVVTIQSNHADKNVEDYIYDYIVMNDGTEKDLCKKAKMFCYNLINENSPLYL